MFNYFCVCLDLHNMSRDKVISLGVRKYTYVNHFFYFMNKKTRDLMNCGGRLSWLQYRLKL